MRILIGLSLLCVSLLQVQASWAASYSLPAASFPPCTGSWSQANNTCNNKIVLAAGDTVEASGSLTIKADAGIELKGSNRLGSNSANVSLASTYGDLLIGTGSQIYGSLSATSGDIVVSAGGNVSGSVSADGALRLTGAWVGGTVSGSGNGTLADSEVVGNVSISNSLTATNSRFGANVSSTGTVSLTLGQSVAGNIVGRNIVLSGMTVGGTVTGNGSGSFSDTTVVGNVSLQNGLGANNAVLHGTLTSSNGAVTFNGGSIAGLMNVGCCQVTVSGGATISNGIRAGNNGITISESTVTGDLSAGSNPIKLTNVAMLSGNISAGGNDVTITGGTLNANVTDANNVKLYGDTNVTGNLQARYTVAVTDSTLTGNIFGSSGYTLQHVYLYAASEVYGDVTVGKTWQTIEGDDQSRIYGVCTYGKVNPPSLCEGGPPKVVHHYELSYASQALTCQPHRVELKACVDEACSGIYSAAQSSVTLSPAGWVGGSTVSFIGNKELFLAIRSPGSVTLGIAHPSPVASGSPALRCRINGVLSNQCALTFADSGLLVSVPPLIAGKSDTLTISAVRKSDNSPACIPAFANVTRPVQLWGSYIDPGPTEQKGNKLIQVKEQPVGSTPVTRNLAFNANGQAQSSVRYDDAGKMQLDARYQGDASRGDAGLVMEGNTQFVSRPYGFCLQTAAVQGNDYSATSSLFPGDVRAGDSFDLTITPVAWTTSDPEPLSDPVLPLQADAICGNPVTPNYQQADIDLTLSTPNVGHGGELGVTLYNHPLGGSFEIGQSISEVGVFQLTATPRGADMSHAVSQSGRVGRFIPASFLLEDPEVTPGCGSFTYAGLVDKGGASAQPGKEGQPFVVSGVLSARNRAGDITRNYKGSFAKLMADGVAYADDGNGVNPITGGSSTAEVTAGAEDGYLAYRNSDLRFRFDTPEAPYRLATRVTVTDTDKVSGSVVDMVVDASGTADPSRLPEFRLGLARVGNAHGSELHDLELPFATAYFDGSNYVPNTLDNCTTFGAASLGPYQHAGSGSGAPSLEPGLYQAVAGGGSYLIKAPADGSSGSARLTYDGVSSWLQFDWDGDGGLDDDDKPSGLATFGIYRGPAPLIFRRELYRQ